MMAPHLEDEHWETFKDAIEIFYLDEDKTLKETRECMESQYGFHAT